MCLHKKKSDHWYRNQETFRERFCYSCLQVTWCKINDYIHDICEGCGRCFDDFDPDRVNPNLADDVLDFFEAWKSFVHRKIKRKGIDIGEYND